ncbi:MAG TPA: hypothetical protein VGS27_29735 [Candidatus Sulfotelmatobacter sp.]|nr:hypothetical protein [Candidatus Sulfotelmatobacter sp.]
MRWKRDPHDQGTATSKRPSPIIAGIQANRAESSREIAEHLNIRGISTARDCEWSPTAMRVVA